MMYSSSNSLANELVDRRVQCEDCSLYGICLPRKLDKKSAEDLASAITRRHPGDRGQHLYRMGDPFTAIYAVRSGAVKTYRIDANGNEQICGFHLPGELVGLDAIVSGKATNNARLLNTTGVCEIRFDRLEKLMASTNELRQELTRLMSREIANAQWQLGLLGNRRAEERLAGFLCHLSQRLHRRGYSGCRFILPMSRRDIGAFLGLTTETVSRLFTRFQKDGLLEVQGKSVELLDRKRLSKLAAMEQGHSGAGTEPPAGA